MQLDNPKSPTDTAVYTIGSDGRLNMDVNYDGVHARRYYKKD